MPSLDVGKLRASRSIPFRRSSQSSICASRSTHVRGRWPPRGTPSCPPATSRPLPSGRTRPAPPGFLPVGSSGRLPGPAGDSAAGEAGSVGCTERVGLKPSFLQPVESRAEFRFTFPSTTFRVPATSRHSPSPSTACPCMPWASSGMASQSLLTRDSSSGLLLRRTRRVLYRGLSAAGSPHSVTVTPSRRTYLLGDFSYIGRQPVVAARACVRRTGERRHPQCVSASNANSAGTTGRRTPCCISSNCASGIPVRCKSNCDRARHQPPTASRAFDGFALEFRLGALAPSSRCGIYDRHQRAGCTFKSSRVSPLGTSIAGPVPSWKLSSISHLARFDRRRHRIGVRACLRGRSSSSASFVVVILFSNFVDRQTVRPPTPAPANRKSQSASAAIALAKRVLDRRYLRHHLLLPVALSLLSCHNFVCACVLAAARAFASVLPLHAFSAAASFCARVKRLCFSVWPAPAILLGSAKFAVPGKCHARRGAKHRAADVDVAVTRFAFARSRRSRVLAFESSVFSRVVDVYVVIAGPARPATAGRRRRRCSPFSLASRK